MRNLLKLLLFFLFPLNIYAQRNITIPQAINLIYKESMLCQRMTKDKIYIIGKTMENSSQKELVSSVILFEKNLKILKEIPLSSDVHKEITSIELMWIGYKRTILNKNYESGINIITYNNILLSACEKVTEELLQIAKNNNEFPFNNKSPLLAEAFVNSNQIKHLSQRLALYYATYFHKISKYDPTVFKTILSEIDTKILKSATLKNLNVNIAEKTENLEYNWKEIGAILQNVKNSNFISAYSAPKTELIFDQCNKLLINSDQLTRAYKAINSKL